MERRSSPSLRILVALVVVSAIYAAVARLVMLEALPGSLLLVLCFPISAGILAFGIAYYPSTNGPYWKRLLITTAASVLMTGVWLMAFMLILNRIMGWGKLLIVVE